VIVPPQNNVAFQAMVAGGAPPVAGNVIVLKQQNQTVDGVLKAQRVSYQVSGSGGDPASATAKKNAYLQ
jgi:hypothetical protein